MLDKEGTGIEWGSFEMKTVSLFALLAIALGLGASNATAAAYGNDEDVAYANTLWQMMVQAGLAGEEAILSKPYKGALPHGDFLDTLEASVSIEGHRGRLLITRNYGAEGELTRAMVANNPGRYLKAVSVMFKREAGYDGENRDWFWSKYSPAGEVLKDAQGVRLAGRVAKGVEGRGCIACHRAAPGGDMVYGSDRALPRP